MHRLNSLPSKLQLTHQNSTFTDITFLILIRNKTWNFSPYLSHSPKGHNLTYLITHSSLTVVFIWKNPDILLHAPRTLNYFGIKQCLHGATDSYIGVYQPTKALIVTLRVPGGPRSTRCPHPRKLIQAALYSGSLTIAGSKDHLSALI